MEKISMIILLIGSSLMAVSILTESKVMCNTGFIVVTIMISYAIAGLSILSILIALLIILVALMARL